MILRARPCSYAFFFLHAARFSFVSSAATQRPCTASISFLTVRSAGHVAIRTLRAFALPPIKGQQSAGQTKRRGAKRSRRSPEQGTYRACTRRVQGAHRARTVKASADCKPAQSNSSPFYVVRSCRHWRCPWPVRARRRVEQSFQGETFLEYTRGP